jgi:hypothetical protein
MKANEIITGSTLIWAYSFIIAEVRFYADADCSKKKIWPEEKASYTIDERPKG